MPVNNPTVAGQLSRLTPSGAKAGVMDLPITLSTDSSESSLPKLPSVPKEFRKLSTAEQSKVSKVKLLELLNNNEQTNCLDEDTIKKLLEEFQQSIISKLDELSASNQSLRADLQHANKENFMLKCEMSTIMLRIEKIETEAPKNNIIIRGLKPEEGESAVKESQVRELFSEISGAYVRVEDFKPYPLPRGLVKATVTNPLVKEAVMRNKRNLKSSQMFARVFVEQDFPYRTRRENQRLYAALKDVKARGVEQGAVLRNGRITNSNGQLLDYFDISSQLFR